MLYCEMILGVWYCTVTAILNNKNSEGMKHK